MGESVGGSGAGEESKDKWTVDEAVHERGKEGMGWERIKEKDARSDASGTD